jgi:hypothetical protein
MKPKLTETLVNVSLMAEFDPTPSLWDGNGLSLEIGTEQILYQRLGVGFNSQTPYGLQLTSLMNVSKCSVSCLLIKYGGLICN